MTNGLKKEDSAALKGLAVLLLIFHHCYRLADRIERYQVDLCGLTTEQLVAIAECCKICVAIFAFVSGYGLRMDIRTSSFHYVRILVYCSCILSYLLWIWT